MRTRHPEADIDREMFFESVFTGWVTSVPVMYNDWQSGTGNATQIPSRRSCALGFPVTFPVWFPNRSRSEENLRAPFPKPVLRFPIHAQVVPDPGSMPCARF
jgi:hypothetical protein